MKDKRAQTVVIGGVVGCVFIIALLVPSVVQAWTSVHLSGNVVCIEGYTRADVTADNTESEAAHVVAAIGGAWVTGDDIPKPSQTKHVSITGPTTFQVTVNYPSDSTPRISNSVTLDVVQGCEATTTTSSSSSSSSTTSSTSSSTTSTTRPTTTTSHPVPPTTPVPTTRPRTTTSSPSPPPTSCTAHDVGSACAPVPPAAVPAAPSFTG